MVENISHIWRKLPRDVNARIDHCLNSASRYLKGPTNVYFRADDVAVPSRQFDRLIRLFARHNVPLALAVVPAWLTQSRWRALMQICRRSSALWCWHQHGWRHVNHATSGKKQEFGAERSLRAIDTDLTKGRQRLETILLQDFYPLFTPPWNRCSSQTLTLLEKGGYRAVSRFAGARPKLPDGLVDVQLNVDLHTRKDKVMRRGWHDLFNDLQQSIAGGSCGIMIHHRRMNDAAFSFLDRLIAQMKQLPQLRFKSFQELTP